MSLLPELTRAVGQAHVLTHPDLIAGYARDWTGAWSGSPLAVVRPGDTAQVQAVVRACRAHGVALVPQGGNTGLVGAAAPADGEVVVSSRRLDGLAAPDPVAWTLLAGAGVVLSRAQACARDHGLWLGVDLASRDSATLGGLVATNAGGARVLRHGMMRAQVAGLEAVLSDGSVLRRLAGLPKDNTGYDLIGLLAGSEGTLAIITRVLLRLGLAPSRHGTAMLAFASTTDAVVALAALRAALPGLDAAEFMQRTGVDLVISAGARPPLRQPHPVYLLVEAVDTDEAALVDVLGGLAGVRDAAVASSAPDRRRLWAVRDGHTEAMAAAARERGHGALKFDVAVPLARLAAFESDLRDVLARAVPASRPILFGHLAEGNLHVNVPVPPGADVGAAVSEAVLRLVAEAGGSISAEHGIGRAKRQWLGLTRAPADIAAMRAVKAALDPAGILSPGRLLPDL